MFCEWCGYCNEVDVVKACDNVISLCPCCGWYDFDLVGHLDSENREE